MAFIDKDVAKASIEHEDPYFVYAIERVPEVDVKPVIHGQWNVHFPLATCSICGNTMEIVTALNFCPNCGADMREE